MPAGAQGPASDYARMIADEISTLRVRRRWTVKHLAQEVGVSENYLNKRLTGVAPLNLNDLEKIANAFGMTPDRLVSLARNSSEQLAQSDVALAAHEVDIDDIQPRDPGYAE